MYKIFLLLVLSLVMISCADALENNFPTGSEHIETPEDGPLVTEGNLLKKWYWRKHDETEILGEVTYEYDEQDRLILETSHYSYDNSIPELSTSGGIVRYTYETDMAIASYYSHENKLKSTTHYIKESNKVIRSEIHYPDGSSRLLGIEYKNDTGCGIRKYEFFNRENQRTGYTEYEYFDGNCSFVGTGYNDDGEVEFKDYVTMDGKNGWHISITQHHHFENIRLHNVLEMTSENTDSEVISSSKNEFIYNSMDYPVSQISTDLYGNKMAYFYEYY